MVQRLAKLPSLWLPLCLLIGVSLVYGLVSVSVSKRSIKNTGLIQYCDLIKTILKVAIFVTAGFAWAVWRADLILAQTWPAELERKNVVVIGTVVDLPEVGGGVTRFLFDVKSVNASTREINFKARVRLRWYKPQAQIVSGQTWRMTVRLRAPRGFHNPDGFDYEAWLFQKHLRATGYVRDKDAQPELIADGDGWIDSIRQSIMQTVKDSVENKRSAALINALTVGYKADIDQATWRVFRRTGTTHLMAISGLHIGLAFGAAYWLAACLWRRSARLCLYCPAHKAAVIVGFVIAAFYAAAAGFSVPTQRALIMLFVVSAGVILNRNTRPLSGLALALLLVLLLDPLAVLASGFWLSFLAVTIIVITLAPRRHDFKLEDSFRARIWRAVCNWSLLQFAIMAAMTPAIALWFHHVSLIAPLCNLIAIPIIGFIVIPILGFIILPASLLADVLALAGVNMAVGMLFQAVSFVIDCLVKMLTWLAEHSWASLLLSPPSTFVLLAATAGGVLLFARVALRFKMLGLLCFVPFVWPSLIVSASPDKSAALKLTVLDVGQGLAVVVQAYEKVLLFDTGARYSPSFDIGSAVIGPYLRAQNIHHIDTLVVSHEDNDHAGGRASIKEEFEIGQFYSGDIEKFPALNYCASGVVWKWGEAEFRFLTVAPDKVKSQNSRSCVLKISVGARSVLLPADIQRDAEYLLVQEQDHPLTADWIIAPHHGSQTSSTEVFLNAVNPQASVISSGYKNHYGHPHESVVNRYASLHIKLFNTATDGAVTVTLKEGTWQFQRMRDRLRRYWHSG